MPALVVGLALIGCGTQQAVPATAELRAADVDVGDTSVYAPEHRGDTDGDGLSDEEEGWIGTDPSDADTDDDELDDHAEVAVHGTDPLHADTDGDWVPDGLEVERGTDPTNAEPPALGVAGLEADQLATITLNGGPPEGDVQVMYGFEPSRLCPPDHNGVCWVMDDVTPWQQGATDALGDAELTAVVPAADDGTPVLVQASVVAPDGTYVASTVVEGVIANEAR